MKKIRAILEKTARFNNPYPMKKSYATAIRLFSCDFLFVDRPLFNFKQVIFILVGNNPDKGNNTDYGSSETGYSFQQNKGSAQM